MGYKNIKRTISLKFNVSFMSITVPVIYQQRSNNKHQKNRDAEPVHVDDLCKIKHRFEKVFRI